MIEFSYRFEPKHALNEDKFYSDNILDIRIGNLVSDIKEDLSLFIDFKKYSLGNKITLEFENFYIKDVFINEYECNDQNIDFIKIIFKNSVITNYFFSDTFYEINLEDEIVNFENCLVNDTFVENSLAKNFRLTQNI